MAARRRPARRPGHGRRRPCGVPLPPARPHRSRSWSRRRTAPPRSPDGYRLQCSHLAAESDRVAGKAGGQGLDHLAQATREAGERRGTSPGAPVPVERGGRGAPAQPEDQTAMLAFDRLEARQRRGQAQPMGGGGVDPGDQGRGHALQGLTPEAPDHKGGEALVAGRSTARQHEIEAHSRLAFPRKERRPHDGPIRVGARSRKALREDMEPASMDHVDPPPPKIGADDARPEASRSTSASAQGFSVTNPSGPDSIRKAPPWPGESRHSVRMFPPSRGPASRSVRETGRTRWRLNSTSRWAAASPAMPPPTTTTRNGTLIPRAWAAAARVGYDPGQVAPATGVRSPRKISTP